MFGLQLNRASANPVMGRHRGRRPLRAESLEPRLTPTAGSLAITEIMYHPSAPSAQETAAGFSEADFDFVELQNVGTEPISLADMSLAGGIEFTFGEVHLAPDEYVVVASDVDAFQFRYGTVVAVAGAYSGSLGNNGEEIEFRDAMDVVEFVFTFDDGWHPETDGNGYSLVLAQPNSDPSTWGQAAAWMASEGIFGSPGRSDGPFDATPPEKPANLTATLVEGTRVDLSWDLAADPDSGVAQYRVSRNGRFLASTTATEFSDTAVPANGAYTYTIEAVNGSLVASEPSDTATVSLPPVGDQPAFAPAQVAGVVTELVGRETSGIVASRRNADVFWVHNDGGRKNFVGINTYGTALGTISLSDVTFTDIEDIAAGPGPIAGQHYIYFGDIGDNDATRTSITIYRMLEPVMDAGGVGDQSATIPGTAIETITLRYPAAAVDSETLLVDPLTGDLYVIAKDAGISRVFSASAASLVNGANILMSFAGAIQFSEPSAGDISPTGREILLRNEDRVRLYVRAEGQSVIQALGGTPIAVPVVGTPTEPNGEGIAFDRQGNHYYTISEGRDPSLYYFHRTSRSPGGGSSIAGDLDGDGRVGLRDLLVLRQNFGMTGATAADGDLDGNGTVDRGDLVQLVRQYGQSSLSPSPTAAASAVASVVSTPTMRVATDGVRASLNSRSVRRAIVPGAVDQVFAPAVIASVPRLTATRSTRLHRVVE